MDDTENASRYKPKAYNVSNQQVRGLSHGPKRNHYTAEKEEEEDVEDEELGEEEEEAIGVRMISKDNYDEDDDSDDVDDDSDSDSENDDNYNEEEDASLPRPRKKRKLKNLISNYEFAPRVPGPPSLQPVPPQLSSGVRDSVADWTDRETFVLLEAWGDRFMKLGRKSLRSEEWQEVAEKVSQETNVERTDTQCRNRLDMLKNKYKKEKTKGSSKWVFYRKLDMLMYSPPQQQASLSCGIDSGEYVFTNPKVYLNHANGLDEMRDSPGNSESSRNEEDDYSNGPPPKKGKKHRGRSVDESSFRLLANSIEKFSEIYEKIEINKRKQMIELENMRVEFHKQLETQRRQILERAQAEIAKIRHGDDDENDLSAENLSR